MLKPEVFEIRFDQLVRTNSAKEIVLDVLRKVCVCEHIGYKHYMYQQENLMTMNREIIFTDCNACGCKMFKQDNLRYLESLIGEDKNV